MSVTISLSLDSLTCSECGIDFAVPGHWLTARRRSHATFYCPNGHNQYFPGKSDVELAKERADRLAQQLASRNEDLKVEKLSHAATRGQLTKARRRAAHGVCPCCHRTFQQLARHMQNKHPDFVTAEATS